MLVNPNIFDTDQWRRDVQAAAQAIGQQLLVLDVSSDRGTSRPRDVPVDKVSEKLTPHATMLARRNY